MIYNVEKNRKSAKNEQMRQGWCISAYDRADNVLKFTDGKGYVCEGEIDAAKYALALGAEQGDVIYVGTMMYRVSYKDAPQGTITMESQKCPMYRNSARYTVAYRAKGEPREPRPRVPKMRPPKVAACELPQPQPQVVVNEVPVPQAATANGVAGLIDQLVAAQVAERVADTEAKIKDAAEQLRAEKDAEIERLTAELARAKKAAKDAANNPGMPIADELGDEVRHGKFDELVTMVQMGMNVYLVGPSGTGKTHAAKQVAKALGLGFKSCGALLQKYELTGFMSPNINGEAEFVSTPLYHAMKEGDLFLFDEIDGSMPEAVLAFNEITANRSYTFPNGEYVVAHPNFRILAAGNTVGRGATQTHNARMQMDGSFLSRFAFLRFDYDDGILLDKVDGDKELVELGADIRRVISEQGLTYEFGTREMQRTKQLEIPFGKVKALLAATIESWAVEDRRLIAGGLSICNEWSKAFAKTYKF